MTDEEKLKHVEDVIVFLEDITENIKLRLSEGNLFRLNVKECVTFYESADLHRSGVVRRVRTGNRKDIINLEIEYFDPNMVDEALGAEVPEEVH